VFSIQFGKLTDLPSG